MSFNVRIFAFRGIEQLKVVIPKQYSSDSVFQLIQPYEWAQLISVSSVAAASAANAASQVAILRIEVPDAQSIRYEINPPNRTGGVVVANTNSPILSGKDQFYFQPGWTVSLIDAAALL